MRQLDVSAGRTSLPLSEGSTSIVGRMPEGRSAIVHRIMAEPLRVPPYAHSC